MRFYLKPAFAVFALASLTLVGVDAVEEQHHHNHHKKRKHHKYNVSSTKVSQPHAMTTQSLETSVAGQESKIDNATLVGRLNVNGPLPADFAQRFQQAAGHATGCDPALIVVTGSHVIGAGDQIVAVDFMAPVAIVHAVEDQAADPNSKLANGNLRTFLVARDAESTSGVDQLESGAIAPTAQSGESSLDVDTEMPYGDLEPFGREDTAQELSEQSIKESNEMVDQLERAEVAEEKRSVFRALTRLRGAAIASFDGIARSQTGNIDEYNKVHSWRQAHPLRHLADEESDVSTWAFPDVADF